jgi:hypothetical protein
VSLFILAVAGAAVVAACVTGTRHTRGQAARRSALRTAGMRSLEETRPADQKRDFETLGILGAAGQEPDGPARN